jgi:GT2 family glycosyltransferase
MYILHLFTLRKSLFLELGGLREEYSGAQDYDLALRATHARNVVHIPGLLYHWRKIPGSAAAEVDAKPEALLRAEAALQSFVQEIDRNAAVVKGLHPGTFRVMWHVDEGKPVTLLMTTNGGVREVEGRGRLRLLDNALRSIVERSTFRNFKILVVDNGNLDAASKEPITAANGRIASFSFKGQFNFAEKMNFAISHVDTEDVILLNDDIEVISEDWIEALLGFSRQAEIGAVGARLLYPNGRVQHQGIVLGVCGLTSHIFHNMRHEDVGYNAFTHIIRNYSAVTGAVLATRLSLLKELGGFDPKLRVDYNDVDYCLRLGELGLRVVYTPFAKLYHFEGSSLARKTVDPADEAVFIRRWGSLLENDPFYNPFLPKDRLDCVPSAS